MSATLFEERRFSEPRSAVKTVTELITAGADGGYGEFDAPADLLVRTHFPSIVEWECVEVTVDDNCIVLHGLRILT